MALVTRVASAPLPNSYLLEHTRDPFPQLKSLDVCPICCDSVVKLVYPYDYSTQTSQYCDHGICSSCLATWIDCQLRSCRAQRQLRIRCVACDKFLPQKVVLESSKAASGLAEELEKRFRLQSNPFYAVDMQVDCIDPTCSGIGYLEYKTVMCFVCHKTWETEDGVAPVEDNLPKGVKRCPRCGVGIEKDGGCKAPHPPPTRSFP